MVLVHHEHQFAILDELVLEPRFYLQALRNPSRLRAGGVVDRNLSLRQAIHGLIIGARAFHFREQKLPPRQALGANRTDGAVEQISLLSASGRDGGGDENEG